MIKNLYEADFDDIDKMSKAELEEYISIASAEQHKFDKRQHAKKILLNSLYGALGTPYFRYFNIHCAEAITLTGQATTAQSFKLFNDYLNGILKTDKDYAVASDTDSVYLDLSDLAMQLFGTHDPDIVLDPLVKLADTVFADMLDDTFNTFAQKINSMENVIVMKREAIARAIFVAKKNYVMLVFDDEGVRLASPKMKVTGLEAIRSSTPSFFQEKLKAGYKMMFNDEQTPIHKFVNEVHQESLSLPAGACAGVTTANNIEKFMTDGAYKSGTPMHIKGAIAYNRLVANSDLYQPIKSGEKVSIVQLVEPNPIGSPVLAYNEQFPSDLLPDKYVNKQLDYDKYFVKPLTRVLDVIGWTHKHEASLESLFF